MTQPDGQTPEQTSDDADLILEALGKMRLGQARRMFRSNMWATRQVGPGITWADPAQWNQRDQTALRLSPRIGPDGPVLRVEAGRLDGQDDCWTDLRYGDYEGRVQEDFGGASVRIELSRRDAVALRHALDALIWVMDNGTEVQPEDFLAPHLAQVIRAARNAGQVPG